MLTALRGAAQPLGLRAFSTSPALSAPRDGHPTSSFSSNPSSSSSSPAAKPRSSTSSLLSLNRPNRRTPRQAQKPKDGQNDDGASTKVDAMTRMLNRYKNKARGEASNVQSAHDYLRQQKISSDYMREMPRRWEVGDVYSPHDLSPAEMSKYRRRQTRQTDVIDLMGIRPQDNYTVSARYIYSAFGARGLQLRERGGAFY